MPFVTGFVSRVGGREHNEDYCNFLDLGPAACWVTADGLGGHRGGEIASRNAVEAVLASFRADPQVSAAALQHHLDAAQAAVLQAQAEQANLSTMRTTIVALIADSTRVQWGHVGDSRLYCLEKGEIAFQTSDHSVVQMLVDAGDLKPEQIRHHEDRNRLLRCLGNQGTDLRPTILTDPRPLSGGSAFLLCTDGFWENVLEREMEVDFAKADDAFDWLTLMEDRLLERATENDDNYTAMAVIFNPEAAAKTSLSNALSNQTSAKDKSAKTASL